jgi:hypothetical protein
MKLENFYISVFLMMSLIFISCESSDDEMETTEVSVTDIQAAVISGPWIVTLYEEDGLDETMDFASFSFTFNEGGVLRADSGNNSISGAWSITSDDDDSKQDIDFNIFFSSPENFSELSEDWDIVSFSNTRIELEDTDDVEVDRLVLEKQ